METESKDLQIVTLGEILSENLSIPGYQRPYRWSTDAALTLVQDLYLAFEKNLPEYRIGSVVLHRDDQRLNIVDGQQRLTTISIMFFILEDKKKDEYKNLSKLLDAEYSVLSDDAIVNNLEVITQKISELDSGVQEEFFTYILDNCTIVKIVVENEQEAFQFFDSQNSRGKGLAPHDLLKAYHLREMEVENEPVSAKIKMINDWENVNQQEMVDLFSEHLYPSICWYKNKNGLNYSTKDIKIFKGIRNRNSYNFSVYNKAANLNIEKFNAEGIGLASCSFINQFQLTQPLIAGKRFFQYSLHYKELYEKINDLVSTKFNEKGIELSGSGDSYIYDMFINILMFYVDRFNMAALTTARLKYFFKWAFSLRLCMKVVYKQSVNKYARGEHQIVNEGINMFSLISEMHDPKELDGVILNRLTREESGNEKSKGKIVLYKGRYEMIYKAILGDTHE